MFFVHLEKIANAQRGNLATGCNLEVKKNENDLNASGKIIIDRTKYDMKFRSGNFFTNLGDTLIYNEFELDVNLTAKLA